MNLNEIRKNIDEIDSQLIGLISKRMDCSKLVAEYKRENSMPVFDAAREQQILDSLSASAGEYSDAVRMIWSTIMEQSRTMQYPYIDSSDICNFKPMKNNIDVRTIACQGVEGAYSSLVGQQLYPNAEIKYYQTWNDVCEAVSCGEAEYGILPVENSWAGSVHEVYDLLISGKFFIAQCADAHISHNLIGMPEAKLSDIKQVISHPQALRQCADFIDSHGFIQTESTNTAVAVSDVAKRGDTSLAAIGSAGAAKRYGLKIINSKIASSSSNTTRFVSITSKPQRNENADKISIVFSVAHTSGSLYRVLSHFASTGMSLTKIESRPIKNSSFEYLFYADLSGNLDNPCVAGVLSSLAAQLPVFTILGNYREINLNLD